MFYLNCLFDRRRIPSKPYFAVIYDSDTKDIDFYQLYQPGTKLSLYDAKKNEEKIKNLFYKEDVVISGFNDYIKAFKLDLNRQYEVYDINLPKENPSEDVNETKKKLLKGISHSLQIELQEWQQILANAQLVYCYLEDKGYYHNGVKKKPIYDLTYTGRSKCLNNNIQGANNEDFVQHVNEDFDVFLHFDWIAADLRIASIISNDSNLRKSFKTSDPYTTIHEELSSKEITREQCKIELLKSLYSLSYESDILGVYPDFAKWMQESAKKIEIEKCGNSILNRKFYIEKDRTDKSVFNAQIQGSVAHAMQCVLYKVFKIFPDNILTEIHDSLVLCCKKEDVKTIVPEIIKIMLYPFEGILNENPRFPIKVSIGVAWKQWKLYKEFR